MRANLQNTIIAVCLVLLAAGLRLLPHPANFAPVAAVAIFGGAVLPRKHAIWVPVVAMMASDLIIGLHNLIAVTWGTYALIALASSYFLRKPNFVRGAALTLSGSLFFFFTTNFAVWIWGQMYAHTWAGLVQCFAMALPFFRNTALSDLAYTASLFGIYWLAIKYGTKVTAQIRARN